MSEPKKLEELLQQIMNNQTSLEKKIENLENMEKQSQSTEKYIHSKHSPNVDFNCPECQALYDAGVSKKAVEDYREKLKKLNEPVICSSCGEIVEKQEEECPTCHGTKAKKIE